MNLDTLKKSEMLFYQFYPMGFDTPEMQEIGKKHRMDKITAFAHDTLSPDAFDDSLDTVISNIVKLVSKSSMVSLFEKPKFRDCVNAMPDDEKEALVSDVK